MKSIVLFLLLVVLSVPTAFAQIKIGDNPQNIDGASVLELESSERVLVITRVNTGEMEAIVPQRGGLVYNTDTECVHYYDGAQWVNLCGNIDGISFSNEHLENVSLGPSILITQNGNTYNFEVAPNSIRSEQIVDGGINGVDIQDNSIGESKLGADSVSSNELRDNSVGSSEVVDGSIRPEDLANTTPEQVLTTDENGIPGWEDATNLTDGIAIDIAENAMDIADHVLNDNDTDDRNELTDISFDKITNILSLTRSETAVGQTTDLSSLIGSDDQTLTLTADNRLQIEDGNEIDLSILNNSGSDNQTLSLNGNTLAITGGNDVSLAGYVNTDNQTLTIAGNTISLTNGGSVNLPPGTVDTDEQQLSIAGNRISLTNGGFVDLPPGTVNTDEQDLTLAGNTINITNGTGVDLTPILGSGADGVVSQVALAGTDLNFTGAGGGFNGTVSLAGLGGGTADGALTNVVLNGTDLEFTSSAGGFTGPVSLAGLGGGGSDGVITNMELTGTDLVVTGTAPGFSGTIPLGTLGGGTDSQQLTLEPGNLLTLENGGTPIDLTSFLDNQTISDFSFDNTTNELSITLEDGNTETVDLTDLAAGGTDNQQLTLEPGNLLTLVDGGTPIDLTPFLDDQTAAEVNVAATPTNYNPTSSDVEGHLAGIDASLATTVSQDLASVLTNGSSAGNSPINDLTDPTLPQDAATLNYVEGRIATILATGGVDGVISNVSASGTGIDFLGSNGGFTGSVDLDPLFVTGAELTTAITNYIPDWTSLNNIPAGFADDIDNDTQYSAGAGLVLTANEFSVDATTVAADWNNLTNIPVDLDLDTTDDFDGEWASLNNVPADLLDGDADTQYTAGAGLVLTANEFSVDATTVAADWNNLTNIPVDLDLDATDDFDGEWASLNNVPADLLDGDADTQYTAGAGLTLTANEFAVDATTVSLDWTNLTGIPADIADGDDDTTLDEAAVDAFVANNGFLNAEVDGSITNEIQALSIAGNDLTLSNGGGTVTLPAAGPADWSTLTGIPADIADGDDDTTLDEAAVDAFVANNGFLNAEVDGSITNEIQALSIAGNDLTLSNGGGTVTLPAAGPADWSTLTGIPADIADGDDDTTLDEAAVDAFVANNGFLNAEVDGSITNEIQALSIAGNDLTLSNGGGTVTLPAAGAADWSTLTGIPADIADGDDDTTLDEAAVDAFVANNGFLNAEVDGSITNEIQALSIAGNDLTLSNGGGTVTLPAAGPADWSTLTGIPADIADGDDDTTLDEAAVDAFVANNGFLNAEVDGSITNEIQALSIAGNDLTLSNGGGTVTLPSGNNLGIADQTLSADRTINLNGNELYFTGTGFIGIGNSNPQNKLHVSGEIRSEGFNSSQGTVGAPAYSFSTGNDSDTGMYRPGNNQLGFSTRGTDALLIDQQQNITIPNGSVTVGVTQVHPDYVFQEYFTGTSDLNENYKFQNLEEIEKFVRQNKHLPGIKSASQVKKEGSWNLSESNIQNLEKIEELFLHTIEQEKKIKDLTSENEKLEQKLEALQNDVEAIKRMLATKSLEE